VVNVSAGDRTAANARAAGDRRVRHRDHRGHRGVDRFLRSLVARVLSGVELVISDAHGASSGHRDRAGRASWQRCRDHTSWQPRIPVPRATGHDRTLVRSVFEQPDRDAHLAQLGDVVDKLTATGLWSGRLCARAAATSWLHRLPHRALAEDPLQQPPGTTEQGDPPADRRGRHLPNRPP